MKHKVLAGVGALVLGLVLSMATLTTAQSNVETLTIGFLGAESGQQGEQDRQAYQAAVLAAEEINADEDERLAGPDDTRYALQVVYYEAETGEEAQEAFDDAVADDAVAVLGPQQRELAESVLDGGTPDVPLLLGSPDSPDATYVYPLSATYDAWASAAADYLVEQRRFERVAIVAANTDVALSGADTFRDAVDDDVIVADLTHDADKEDFSADARTIRDSDAQALFVWTLDSSMIALLEALDAVRWDGVIVYAGLDAQFLAEAGALIPANFYGTAQWSASAYDADSQAFVAAYVERWGQTPPDSAAAYYDAVYLLAEAVREGGDSASSINTELNAIADFDGVQGVYDATVTDGLLLVQASAAGVVVEAARYANGDCTTCPNLWVEDTTNEDIDTVETFNIGLIATLDGAAEDGGTSIEQAARLAVREINDAGGIVGTDNVRYTLNLQVYSATTQEEASSAFDQAVEDGMQIILGPDWNAQILPDLYSAEGAEVVQLVSATDTRISSDEPANYVFQLRATDEARALAVADYLLNVRDFTQFATVAVRADYGLDAAAAFSDTLADSEDGELVLSLEHDVDASDFTGLADEIVAAGVETVVVWTTQPAANSLLAALNERGWDGVFVYGYLTAEFAQGVPAAGVEVIGIANWTAGAGDWVSQDFAGRYSARYGEAPTAQGAAYYDAIYLLANGLAEGSADDLQGWLIDLDQFIGVQGIYTPADYGNGELTRGVVIVRVEEQRLVEIARYTGADCLVYCE